MAKMLVTYRVPKDEAAFARHYFETHIPLAKKLPGLRKYEVSEGPVARLGGGESRHFVAILHFDDRAAIERAFASAQGLACAADRREFAPDDAVAEMLIFDSREV